MHLTIRAERINLKEENFMNVVLKEKDFDVHETLHEEYENANNDEVMKISERLLEKHKEAYTALANA